MEKYGRPRQAIDNNIIRRMRFVCWITRTSDTHSEYVILTAIQRQQLFPESASVFRLVPVWPSVMLVPAGYFVWCRNRTVAISKPPQTLDIIKLSDLL